MGGLALFRVLQGVRVLEVGWDRYHPLYYAVYVLFPLPFSSCVVPVCVCSHYHYAHPVCASGVPFANQVAFLSFIVFFLPRFLFTFLFFLVFAVTILGFFSSLSFSVLKKGGREGVVEKGMNEGRGRADHSQRMRGQ